MKPAALLYRQTRGNLLTSRSSAKTLYAGSTRRHFSDAKVITDQTKKNNSPDEEYEPDHAKRASSTTDDSEGKHPAKQADPQKPPTRSTGIEPSGPDGDAKDEK